MNHSLDQAHDFPKSFLLRMQGMLGKDYDNFLSSLYLPASIGLRVNTLKNSPSEFIQISPYNLLHVPWCSSGYTVESGEKTINPVPPGKHPYHQAGLYYLQEPSAMAAAEELAPQPGEKVLDITAAPGGKATHLAALMGNTGLLVANEIHPKRVWDLVENLERCGVTNAVVTNETPQRMADHFGEYFDRVMLDAPCSGEGMFRKSELARKEWKPGIVRSCALRQASILEQAARMVKPGGCIAYTTCTYSAEENEGVIATFLTHHPEFNLATLHHAPGYRAGRPEWIGLPPEHIINRVVRIWPHLTLGEGHFVACLTKNSDYTKRVGNIATSIRFSSTRNVSLKNLNKIKVVLDDYCKASLNYAFEYSCLMIDGGYIYQLPLDPPNLNGLKVIRVGWWLGTIKKDRFTPSHSLAMGIKADQARQILTFHPDDQQLSSYYAGESFPNSGSNSWVLVTVDGFPIGWGKRVQNVIKNFYPHGLRRQN